MKLDRGLVSNGTPMQGIVGLSGAVRVGPLISIGGTATVGAVIDVGWFDYTS